MSVNRTAYPSEQFLQEKMWIEIIQSVEHLYAELANNQAKIEKKNEELSQAKEFIENVLENMAETLLITDNQGTIKKVNKATLHLLGYLEEEILGRPIRTILYLEEGRENLLEEYYLDNRRGPERVQNFDMNYLTKEGEKIPMSFSSSRMKNTKGRIVGVIMVARDMRKIRKLLRVTKETAKAERKKAQELRKAYQELQNLQNQLVQSEKLASIGRLAAGVAHEINNPLTGVLTFAHLLLSDIPDNDSRRDDLEIIVKEATRCRLVAQNLLDFARQNEPQKTPTDINRVVEEILSLLENQVRFQNIKIMKNLHPSLPALLIDANQIQQAFMNIILNAQEAMFQRGSLTVGTDLSEDGDFVEVKFIDTGCGIPKENLSTIFEPFFTTKDVGKGTGLGLAITYGITKRHGGDICVRSREGKGTTIIVRLPVNTRR